MSEAVPSEPTAPSGRIERLQILAILVAAWVALLVYAYPGYLSFDSVVQLREARAGAFSDWHPPAMAALWRVIDLVHEGPFGMLVLQSTTFLIGSYLILRRFVSGRSAALWAGLILLFPPVATTMAVIWKDSQMMGTLMLGTGLILGGRRSRIAALAAFAMCSATRHNAFTFTFPIVVLLWHWRPGVTKIRRYGSAMLAWAAVTGAALLVNVGLTATAMHPWHSSVALFDLVGTLRFSGDSDNAIRSELQGVPLEQTDRLGERIHHAYSPSNGVFKIVDDHLIREPVNDLERAAIARAWRTVIAKHPVAYLHHRWSAFRELLALQGNVHQWVWVGVEDIGQDLVPYVPSEPQALLQDWALRFGRTWLMRPYFYLLVICALLPMVVRSRHPLLIALASSAITSELALFFISPTPDFRYSSWLPPTSLLLAVGLFALRRRSRITSDRRP